MAQTVKEKRTLVRFADGMGNNQSKYRNDRRRQADNDRLFLRRMAFVLRGGGYTTTVRRRYPPRPRAYAVRQSRLRRLDNKRRPHIP